MSDEPDYYLDVKGLEQGGDGAQEDGGRPWIGVRFDCCGAYVRIYRNREGTAYEGRCPRCLRPVRARIGPGGINSRFFTAE